MADHEWMVKDSHNHPWNKVKMLEGENTRKSDV